MTTAWIGQIPAHEWPAAHHALEELRVRLANVRGEIQAHEAAIARREAALAPLPAALEAFEELEIPTAAARTRAEINEHRGAVRGSREDLERRHRERAAIEAKIDALPHGKLDAFVARRLNVEVEALPRGKRALRLVPATGVIDLFDGSVLRAWMP